MPTKPTPGSITQTADSQKDRINNISNVSSAINAMQKDVDQKISETNKRVERKDEVQAVQGLMSQSISKLNQTLGALTTGIAKITTDTARATAGAINQYGKAISEDISFNKKSVVAMALAKTSPIYGYFVSKFMETNVWKQALTKMKTSIMQTMGAILRPFKGSPASRSQAPTPTQAQGAYPGEALGKVRADHLGGGSEGFSSGDVSQLISIQQQQLNYMQRTFGYEEKYYKSWFSRMSPMRLVRAFRRTKGNYTAQLSSSKQPLTNIAHNIATLYTQLMWRFDNLLEIQKANAVANRDLAMHTLKIKYPPIPGIRMRQLVKPLIRKVVSGAIKAFPLLAMAAGLAGGGLPGAAIAGTAGLGLLAKRALQKRDARKRAEAEARGEEYKGGFLTKRRGVYADAPKGPGFIRGIGQGIKGKFRQFLPTGRQLEMGGMEPGAFMGGGFQRGERQRNVIRTASEKRSMIANGRMIATGFSQTLGGRKGLRRPIWVAPIPDALTKKYYSWSKTQDKIQTRTLKKIRDSNEDQHELQRRTYKRASKWRLIDKIMGFAKMIGGLFKSLLPSLGLGIAALGIGAAIGTYIDDKFFGPARKKWNEMISQLEDIMRKDRLTKTHALAQEYVDTLEKEPLAKMLYGQRGKKGLALRQKREKSLDKPNALMSSLPGGSFMAGPAQWLGKTFSGTPDAAQFSALVFDAQTEWRNQHISEYYPFHPDEVTRLRDQWISQPTGGFRGVRPGEFGKKDKPNLEAIKKYAHKREESFLKYLKSKGTKMTESESKKLFSEAKRQKEAQRRKSGAVPEGSTGLYGLKIHPGGAQDSSTGKIDQSALSKNQTEVIEKQAELTSTPVVNKLDDVKETIKGESQNSTIQLQNTTIQSSNQITSSVNDSTTVSGGGGRQREGLRADGWYQRAIFSGGR
jgi:hypothetical protein